MRFLRRWNLFHADNWLRSPTDREIIARWSPEPRTPTLPIEERHRLEISGTGVGAETDSWEFLALGDTGDADASGALVSPQDAVARELTRDAAAPIGQGSARMVLHTGDVIYMAGERRLYERNFRRPYAAFLTPESTVDSMVFRVPFLPVPGNHDYYDMGGWANWLSRIPLVARGLRAIAHEFLGYRLPESGSDMGRAFMEAFVRPVVSEETGPLSYRCGEQTRLPHRYYQFTLGKVDFFALDSNTLDAPPPVVSPEAVRKAASQRAAALEQEAAALEAQLKREQKVGESPRQAARAALAESTEERANVLTVASEAERALETLVNAVFPSVESATAPTEATVPDPRPGVRTAYQAWRDGTARLTAVRTPAEAATALDNLDTVSDQVCDALSALQSFLAALPGDSPERAAILAATAGVERTQASWSAAADPGAAEDRKRVSLLSERALDIQRELALEQRRQQYAADDFDRAQLDWLNAALAAAERERPDNWRIVFLHHPLYTSIYNHCERPDVRGLRGNLLGLLQSPGRVHLVLSGHSHAFEWYRSEALPHTGIFVTGGGGQIALRASVFSSRYRNVNSRHRAMLYEAGVRECAVGGRGPGAADGVTGSLYHYLRISVGRDTLRIAPVGVRRLKHEPERGRYRREEPMPVYHVANLPRTAEESVPRSVRRLRYVEVYRDRPPEAHWEGDRR